MSALEPLGKKLLYRLLWKADLSYRMKWMDSRI